MSLKVLYEDNHLIAVYKPAGVLTQGDKTGEASLMDQVKYYLKNKYQKAGQCFFRTAPPFGSAGGRHCAFLQNQQRRVPPLRAV